MKQLPARVPLTYVPLSGGTKLLEVFKEYEEDWKPRLQWHVYLTLEI